MPSHINEAATSGGAVVAGSRLELLINGLRGTGEIFQRGPQIDLVVPLSGVTRQFDRNGRCIDCQ
jgi:hypothetical protein